jgi:hypothetical protein
MAGFFRARTLVLLVSAVLLSLLACQAHTDLGKPDCHLLKKGPDGGPVNVTIAELSAGKDFLSFGSVECEDLVCVLDVNGVSQALAAATANPAVLNQPALGYCSRACAQGSSSTCTPQYNDLQDDPALVMTCRQLVLDATTIAEICKDPAKCLAYFDNNRSPFFCARGGDGGT